MSVEAARASERMSDSVKGLDEYQALALRTAGRRKDGSAEADNPATGGREYVGTAEMRTCWALGLAGESGEFADLVKKEVFHRHTPDYQKQALELGDVLWYLAVAARAIGYDLSEVASLNVEKLRTRYPEGFSTARSKNRTAEDRTYHATDSPRQV